MRNLVAVLALLLVIGPAVAQQSASYKLAEHAFNAGGHPEAGAVLISPSFRVTLDAVGDACVGTGMTGTSYRMDAGFGSGYPPPGEVRGLWFSDRQTLHWDPEPSVGDYNMYRALLTDLASYGACQQQDIPGATTTDTDQPSPGDGFFYLVTAENRLDEEGSMGTDSDGTERLGTPCP